MDKIVCTTCGETKEQDIQFIGDGYPDMNREVRYTPGQVGTVEEKRTDPDTGVQYSKTVAYQYGWNIRTMTWPDGELLDVDSTEVITTVPCDD